MTRGEAERQLRAYRDLDRDALVTAAVAAGISKHRIHVLSGISRSTIDRIILKGRESS